MATVSPGIAVPGLVILVLFSWYIGSYRFDAFKGIIEQKAIKLMVDLMLVTILYGGLGVMASLVPRIFCFPITTVILETLLIIVAFLAIPASFLWVISAVQPGKIKVRNLALGFLFIGFILAPMITISHFNEWGIGISCLFNSCGGLICP